MPITIPLDFGTRIPIVLDALYDLFTANLTPLPVYDGMLLQNVEQAGLLVGASLDHGETPFQQIWAGQGRLKRNEHFQIPNLLWRITGDNDRTSVKATRDAVKADLGAIEYLLRQDPTLGISPGFIIRAQFGTAGSFHQEQTGDGFRCRVDFTIDVETRI